MSFFIPGFVRDDQIDVVIAVSPVETTATGHSQIDPVIDRFVTTIDGTVVVHHRGNSLVDILCREVEHVVVEPVGTHCFPPVAWDACDPARPIWRASSVVGAGGVNAVVPRQDDGPAVIVELTGEKEGLCVTVTLGWSMPVVLVRCDRVQPEDFAIASQPRRGRLH